jgi:hypothetical protein
MRTIHSAEGLRPTVHRLSHLTYRKPLFYWTCRCGEWSNTEWLNEVDAIWWAELHRRSAHAEA